MTDAKGLSSTDLIEALRDPDLLDGARQHYITAIAERLKSCEGEIRHIDDALARRPALADKPDRLHKILYTTGEAKRCDQLTADLEELKLRLKMEAECHEQTVADLERARAEVERLRLIKREAVGAFNEAAKENERLKAALVLCDPDGHRLRLILLSEDDAVRELCERIGYGAVMDSAARQWRKKDPIGAFTVGPCVATVQAALRETP